MNKFKELRKKLSITQEEFRRQFNERYGRTYTAAAISQFENDKRTPETSALVDFANFFGVSIDYLLGNDAPSSSAHSKKDTADLAKFLDKTEVMFDGDTYHLDDEGKQKLRNALEFVFWDAKKQNKRKATPATDTATLIGKKILKASPDAQIAVSNIINQDKEDKK